MTHAELVDRAVRWLRTTMRCGVVLREYVCWLPEQPDAIGWTHLRSVMVECKVSRADFRADLRKPGRLYGRRLARECYYLVPRGLISPNEVPAAWGLLYLDGKRIRKIKASEGVQADERGDESLRAELALLYSEVRRYQLHGITYPKIEVQGGAK